MIEQRDTDFQAVRHTRPVDLNQNVVGKIALLIAVLHPLYPAIAIHTKARIDERINRCLQVVGLDNFFGMLPVSIEPFIVRTK